jgi:DNA helicase-2/ATP-dependent DNA helicase PcrA
MDEFAASLRAGGALAPLDFRGALNDDQYAAVTAPGGGPALVLAGAGSGKTRTLTYRVAWLLQQGVAPWEILLLTFTNKAAREMLGRVEELTGVPRGRFWGGTFHSVGQRILRRHGHLAGLERNFTIMDEGDAEALLGDVIRAKDPSFTKHKEHPKPSVVHNFFSYARNTRQTLAAVIADKYPWLEEIRAQLEEFSAAYQQAKREKQVADYDDLLDYWLLALERDPAVRAHYQSHFRHILVDEYQDTNKLQSDIVDLLAADHQIMAVGDDAQCIYTWRGANFDNIRLFPERHPGAVIYKIEINYRSTPEILAFANGILESQPAAAGFHKHLRPDRPAGRKPLVIAALDTRQQAQLVIARLRELHENDGVPLRDVAVLYRAHYQAMDLQLELSRAAIPFTITSGVRFFEQAHVRDLVAHLRFAHNPRDTVAFLRLAALLPKVGPRTADRALAAAQAAAAQNRSTLIAALTAETVRQKIPDESRGDFHDLALTLQNLEEALAAAGAARLHPVETSPTPLDAETRQDTLFDDEPAPPPPQPSPLETPNSPSFSRQERDSEGKKTETRSSKPTTPAAIVRLALDGWYGDYLRNLYDNWQSRREDLDSLVGFASRFSDMNELLAQLVLLNSESGDRSAEPDADTVRLTTIHQAKGLEFPVVFLIGAADGLLPLKRAIDNGDVEEERRLFYVGATRARDELCILYPRVVTQGGPPALLPPSRFLQELSTETFDQFRAAPRGY